MHRRDFLKFQAAAALSIGAAALGFPPRLLADRRRAVRYLGIYFCYHGL